MDFNGPTYALPLFFFNSSQSLLKNSRGELALIELKSFGKLLLVG